MMARPAVGATRLVHTDRQKGAAHWGCWRAQRSRLLAETVRPGGVTVGNIARSDRRRVAHSDRRRADLPRRPLGLLLRDLRLLLGLRLQDVAAGVPSTYSPDRLMPLSGGIRDGAHPRGAPPPRCPDSAAAHSVAPVRPWPTTSGSGSRCSSRRTSTGSPADAVRRSPRHSQGIPVESIQSRARHRRFARASGAQWPLRGYPTSWPDAKIVLHRLGPGPGSDALGPPP